jgi:hypothetical protein
MNTKEFFDAIFEWKEKDEYILIWSITQGKKISRYFKDTEGAAQYALSLRDKSEVYFGLCPGREEKTKYERYTANEVSSLHCVWLDIDLYSPAHSKRRLPVDMNDVSKVFERIRFNPDIVVDSGHGLHCYWLLKEPVPIHNVTDNINVGDTMHDWMDHMKDVFAEFGWEVDSTCDLSRVLRVPGTLNHKLNPVKEVRVQNVDQLRGIQGVSQPGSDAKKEISVIEGDSNV